MSQLNKTFHWIVQPALVVGILLFGFIGAMSFTLFEDEPEKAEPPTYAPLVRTITAPPQTHALTIHANGSVQARTRIELVPQVGGRIHYIHPNLRAGGTFEAGALLLEVEPVDFELAVTQAQAEVAAALTTLELEQAEAEAAREEWLALNPDENPPTLVSREPQIAEAKAQWKAAQARLAQAQLNLKRTRLSLPFAGRVVEASVDVGGVVTANQPVGVVYSTEQFEIPVPLELHQLAWIQLEGDENSPASTANIVVDIGAQRTTLPARIARIDSELEQRSRFARIILTLQSKDIPASLQQKMIPGLFVDVEIMAQRLDHVSVIPRAVLRQDETLWTVKDGRIEFLQPEVVYRAENEILLRGLDAHTEIVASELEVVTAGMAVRVAQDTQ